MSPFGRLILKISPKLYKNITLSLGRFLSKSRTNDPFITDSLGGDFKDFLSTLNENDLEAFYQGFDSISIAEIKCVIERLENIPNHTEWKSQKKRGSYKLTNDFIAAESNLKNQITEEVNRLKKEYPFLHIEDSVAYFHHGLKLLPQKVIDSLISKKGDLLDIGAYHGDSAFFLSKYVNNIYSFDISEDSINRYKRNMRKLGLINFNIEKLAITDISGETIKINDNGSAGLSLNRENTGYNSYHVNTITIDDYCKGHTIKPTLIKADMEGSALSFVSGAIFTIKKFRPVLSIAVYHNPDEFFKIKPILMNELDNYEFIMRKLSSETKLNECHSEVYLIAFPKEMNN